MSVSGRLTVALRSPFQLESLAFGRDRGSTQFSELHVGYLPSPKMLLASCVDISSETPTAVVIAKGEIGRGKFCVQFHFSHQWPMQWFSCSALAYGNDVENQEGEDEEGLTKCEEAEDDGVGDEVDGVAGAGEVELPAPNALVH